MDIQVSPSSQIDAAKWDACIDANSTGLIYATAVYLNAMTDNWSGLVINNYETVMPLPWRKKWGIRYLYAPPFMQKLGLVGACTALEEEEIIKTIKSFVSYGDYFFNSTNLSSSFTNVGTVALCSNYIIDLSVEHSHISQNYSKSLANHIKKARIAQLSYLDADINDAIDAFQKMYGERMIHVTTKDFVRFKSLCEELLKGKKAFARKVIDAYGNLLGIALFLKDDNSIYNLMSSTLSNGREQHAMHFLLDSLFQEYTGQSLLFDFEGSDLPGVKQFYQQFGGINKPHTHWHFNSLPWPLNILKK